MRIYRILPFLLLPFLLSCKDDNTASPQQETVNDFIWKGLNQWYFWQEDVPDLADNRFGNNNDYRNFLKGKSPDNLFNSLLYTYQNTDRFSWIVDDYLELENSFAGINRTFGMKYGLVYISGSSNEIFGYVQYILPGSPAEAAGMKRGDIFTRIDGTRLTSSNYISLLNQNSAVFGMAYIQGNQIFDSETQFTLNKVEMQENPVYMTKVFSQDNHKIGYLVYNGFRANFNNELNEAIGELKSQNITDLIIDLRYNGGGSVQTCAYLGSMITGQFNNEIFTRIFFNDKRTQFNNEYIFENQGKLYNDNLDNTGSFGINHLGLNSLYVITTGNSASASEMLITSLKDYITVKKIGTKTYGKTVGSITLYDSPSSEYTSKNKINTTHRWAMQPIVFNAKSNQGFETPNSGIQPDKEINELNYLSNLTPLGEWDEPLLLETIQLITGSGKGILQPGEFEGILFKTSQDLEKFGTEMYLDKGSILNP